MRPTTHRPAPRGAGVLSVLLLAAACGGTGGGERTPPTGPAGTLSSPAASTPAASTPAASTTGSTPAPSAAGGVPGTPVDVTTGLDVPWGLAVLPDGTALVTLRDEARVVRTGPGVLSRVAATGEDGRVDGVVPGGEGGLLGIALSPGFAQDGQVYLFFTARDDNRVVRFTYAQDRLSDPRPVLTGIPKNSTHNGGRIAFGPDGMLYVGTGDAQDRAAAQDPRSLAGKVLRVTTDGAVPADNPFEGSPTWSYGHRNPQGFDWDSTGRLIASEFGQDAYDELNVIRPGGNYGWPVVEGPGDGGGRFVAPVQTWSTAEASPSGVAVTSDAVLVAGLRGERLWRVPLTPEGPTGTPEAYLQGTLGRLRSVEVGPDGSLWLLTSNTFRGEPRAGDDRLVSVPLT
ncbi:PQQ-dependent sugar dehydrogenase [Paenibacillus sp. TRM 82003]|uniref:PQQ-dependent sugar dehydrogenase n=1 Tax=Kineococcus sp. TRM81007 TaxID=2925831 RepID=UPI001F571203|nr:PQQ-dependent sugar dehydrogenase [Kineococcus sp. TRM81007]MCI2239367.1 PQQ-dependent sugar dehydrogenase [Kineococcus sp. TRM81007]MCI3925049.1 PQQ-dependent sugar dehydrogenase [Paenibacillus sp. TRM 82003]